MAATRAEKPHNSAESSRLAVRLGRGSLLPTVRRADAATLVLADGPLSHVARVPAMNFNAQEQTQSHTLPQRKPSMPELTLDVARKILDAALAKGVEKKLKPLVITILDARGCVKVTAAQDGTSLMRAEIAHGKAYGALAMGIGSRALFQRAQEQAYFICAVNTLAQGRMVPVPGGVLIQSDGGLLGAVGVSGDTSDNDEACAVAGIEAAGLKANAG